MKAYLERWIRQIFKWPKGKGKKLLSAFLAFVMLWTGIPFIPGGGVQKAHAGTSMTESQQRIMAVYHENADIRWIYDDPPRNPLTGELLITSHPTIVSICEGGSRELATGDYAVLVEHNVQWNGQFADGFAKDGTYKACVLPTNFPGEKGTSNIQVSNPNPPAPKYIEILPNEDKQKNSHIIRGIAEIGTKVKLDVELTRRKPDSKDEETYRPDPNDPLANIEAEVVNRRTWSADKPVELLFGFPFPGNQNLAPVPFCRRMGSGSDPASL